MTGSFPAPPPETLAPARAADALVRGEDAQGYQRLRRRLVAEMRPRDCLEEMLVGDVCDLAWEAARYRRIRARALEARMDLGVARIVEPHEDDYGSSMIADGWARGDERTVRRVDKALAAARLGPEHVAACAFLAQVGEMERLERLIAAAETRRAAALREIERHRAARQRALADIADVAQVDDDVEGRVQDELEEAAPTVDAREAPPRGDGAYGAPRTAGVSAAATELPAGSRRSQDADIFESWGGLA